MKTSNKDTSTSQQQINELDNLQNDEKSVQLEPIILSKEQEASCDYKYKTFVGINSREVSRPATPLSELDERFEGKSKKISEYYDGRTAQIEDNFMEVKNSLSLLFRSNAITQEEFDECNDIADKAYHDKMQEAHQDEDSFKETNIPDEPHNTHTFVNKESPSGKKRDLSESDSESEKKPKIQKTNEEEDKQSPLDYVLEKSSLEMFDLYDCDGGGD
jgi:hypothetical protein